MAPRAEAQRLVIAAGPHPDGITNQQDDLQQSHHQKGEGSADDVDLSNLLERSRPQSSSASHSTGASSLKDERGRRLSRGTFLAVDNEFVASQVGHLGKPTPSVQISAPEEQPRILPDDEEESRAPSRHSDFKSITTIDDFGFSVGLTQNNWSGPRRRASSNSLHPHYLGDGTQTPAYQPDDGDTPSTFIGLGEMFSPSLPARSATVEELGKDLDDESYLTYVNRQLRDEFEYSQHDAHGGLEFLPLGKLVLLLDEKKISHVLRRALSGTAEKINTLTSAIHSPNHQDSRRMILAVLILIDKVVCIEDLIHNDIRDIHLPLRLHKGKKRCSAVQIQKRSAIEVICLDKWKWSEMESFINMQYRVLAPFFDMPLDDLHFYKIDDVGIILPFLEWKKKTSGGYGTVWKVQIHSDHHNFANLDGPRNSNPYFAVKEIHSNDYEAYKQEVRVLERFSGPNRGHAHLIRLRVAFQHAKNYYLLFDWANGNLVDLWKQTPNPTASPELARWLVKQCLGIADGLRKIHHHGSWYNEENSNGVSHSEDADKNRGRHGDIKPENILYFMPPGHKQSRLVVSDFGLTRFHSSKSVSRVPLNKVLGFSRTYRPPEFDTQRHISQAYDMWSLGCLYLEFVSWFLVGYEETRETFQNMRLNEDNALDCTFPEDKFFNLKSRRLDPSNSYDAQVKDCVVKWIDDLQRRDNCSQCIRDFLYHIKHSLLVPDPNHRGKIDQFNTNLTQIDKLCKDSIGYCDALQRYSPDGHESGVPVIGQPIEVPSNSGDATDDPEDLGIIIGKLKNLGTNRVEEGSNTSDASATIEETIRVSQHVEMIQGTRIVISQRVGDYETSVPPTNGDDMDKPETDAEDTIRTVCYSKVAVVLTQNDTDLTALSLATGHSGNLPTDTPFTTQRSENEFLIDEVNIGEAQSASTLERTVRCDRVASDIALPLLERQLSGENSQIARSHLAGGPERSPPARSHETGTHLEEEEAHYPGVNEEAHHWERDVNQSTHSPDHVERGLQDHTATTMYQTGEPGLISQQSPRQNTELKVIPAQQAESISGRPSDTTIACPDTMEGPKWQVQKNPVKKRVQVGRMCRRVVHFLCRWRK